MSADPLEVEALLDGAIPEVFPGAAAIGSARGRIVVEHASGQASMDTIWDLASLTKPMCVGTTCLWAVDEGVIDLDEDVFGRGTVAQLLGHVSGLPAHRVYWLTPEASRRQAVLHTPPDHAAGVAEYSDVGYLLLGWFLEERLGASLDSVFERVRREFGLTDTSYHPSPLERVAPTEDCAWRGRVVRGEVHDPNAAALGGVCGHAGLFGTARDVHRWCLGLLDAWHDRPSPVSGAVLRRFLRPQPKTTWRLGFDSVSPVGSSAGTHFGPASFGHLGFTGTSFWIDPQREWVVVLLSNRVHPRVVPDPEIKRLRPCFHDAFARRVEARLKKR